MRDANITELSRQPADMGSRLVRLRFSLQFPPFSPGLAVPPKGEFWAEKATHAPRQATGPDCLVLQYRRHEGQEATETAINGAWCPTHNPRFIRLQLLLCHLGHKGNGSSEVQLDQEPDTNLPCSQESNYDLSFTVLRSLKDLTSIACPLKPWEVASAP